MGARPRSHKILMTTQQLYAQLEPIVLELDRTSSELGVSEENRVLHCATAILGIFMGTLLEANSGKIQPLIDLVFAVGMHLGVISAETDEEITH